MQINRKVSFYLQYLDGKGQVENKETGNILTETQRKSRPLNVTGTFKNILLSLRYHGLLHLETIIIILTQQGNSRLPSYKVNLVMHPN